MDGIGSAGIVPADVASGPRIVDLKTADELDTFEMAMRAFGYLHQVAFYRALVAQASGHIPPVHIVAVEKREPFRCGVWQVAGARRQTGRSPVARPRYSPVERWPEHPDRAA